MTTTKPGIAATSTDKPASQWFVVSVPEPDREMDEIISSGCRWQNWQAAGAPWFFEHAKMEGPVGSSLNPKTGQLDFAVGPNGIKAACHFNMETLRSREVSRLVAGGHLRGASVGLAPLKLVRLPSGGVRVSEWDLIEISLTSTPVCPRCLASGVAKCCCTGKALHKWHDQLLAAITANLNALSAPDREDRLLMSTAAMVTKSNELVAKLHKGAGYAPPPTPSPVNVPPRPPGQLTDGQRQALVNLSKCSDQLRQLIPALRSDNRRREAERCQSLATTLDKSLDTIRETRARRLAEDFQDLCMMGRLLVRRFGRRFAH
jgi:hypothetical protein